MSATIRFFSEFDRLSFECSDDEPSICIYSRRTGDSVRLNLLDAADRANLRAALDAADKIAGLLESETC
jgi:hypothetical protein